MTHTIIFSLANVLRVSVGRPNVTSGVLVSALYIHAPHPLPAAFPPAYNTDAGDVGVSVRG